MPTHYLACDLGADSGRLMLGTLADGKISLEELHRFPNGPVKTSGALHWNIDGLFNELKNGLKKAAAKKMPFAGISTDSWGVDYVLYDERGLIMPPVWCYRDSRTALGVENVKAKVDWPAIFPRPESSSCRSTPFTSSPPNRPNVSPKPDNFCLSAMPSIISAPASLKMKFPSPARRNSTIRTQRLVEKTF